MIILNLVQGSKEWLEKRAKYFTASEAPAMMGESKYMTRDELLHMKKTGITKPVTPAQQAIFDKGHATEDMARPIVEQMIGEDLYPVTGVMEGKNLLASFDGLTLLEDVAFEHKLFNKTLAENVRNGVLEPHYYWQLEQQLLVAGAEKVIFVTSDGTEGNMEHMEYASVPARRQALLAGWNQFADDLANYQVEAKIEKVKATTVAELPALNVELTGQVNNSNLAVYKMNVLEFVQSINTDLQTDQDFADAENIVKFCSKAEKEIEAVKNRALDSTADIKTLFAELDVLKEEMRQKRLSLDKTVKSRKIEVKNEITTKANKALNDHVVALNVQLDGVVAISVERNFVQAIKNKRTVESIQSAANDHLAQCKIKADSVFKHYNDNLAYVEENAADYKFLLNDITQIISQDAEHFALTVDARVRQHLEHLAAEKQRELERQQLEQQAQAEAQQSNQNESIDAAIVAGKDEPQSIGQTIADNAPTLAQMPSFESKTLSVTTDDVAGLSELAAIFGEQNFGELLYDDSGNRYKLQIDVTRVAIESSKAA